MAIEVKLGEKTLKNEQAIKSLACLVSSPKTADFQDNIKHLINSEAIKKMPATTPVKITVEKTEVNLTLGECLTYGNAAFLFSKKIKKNEGENTDAFSE